MNTALNPILKIDDSFIVDLNVVNCIARHGKDQVCFYFIHGDKPVFAEANEAQFLNIYTTWRNLCQEKINVSLGMD